MKRTLSKQLALAALLATLTLTASLLAAPRAVAAPDETQETAVIFLQSMTVAHAVALYERVLGNQRGSAISEGRSAATVIVRDSPERVARFRALVKALDAAGAGEDAHLYIRPVVTLRPSDLADVAREVIDGDKQYEGVVLVPDDRTDQLVVRATPARYKALDKLLRRLDRIPDRRGDRQIRTLPAPP